MNLTATYANGDCKSMFFRAPRLTRKMQVSGTDSLSVPHTFIFQHQTHPRASNVLRRLPLRHIDNADRSHGHFSGRFGVAFGTCPARLASLSGDS
jgi:hypothetical protein